MQLRHSVWPERPDITAAHDLRQRNATVGLQALRDMLCNVQAAINRQPPRPLRTAKSMPDDLAKRFATMVLPVPAGAQDTKPR